MLRSPEARESDNVYYDENVFGGPATPAVGLSTRNVTRAIYEPMAEGVAEVYAADPAVASAGLEEEDFVRLFVALIDQESRFNPAAVSPKGARGLGQLMPETAALLGVDAGEPMANLHGAARYLTAQLAEFGRVDLALAAYNAGPERRSLAQGYVPAISETRNYVRTITTNWLRLTQLNRPDSIALSRAAAASTAIRASGYREVSLTVYDGMNSANPI